ncbi:MAG: hypothetical protein ABJ239_12150 [Erythrobacter sp.]
MATTGTIDTEAVGKGRVKLPTWLSYMIGWLCFTYCFWLARPIWRYWQHPEIFRINSEGIIIANTAIPIADIEGSRFSFIKGNVLQTKHGEFPIHPELASGATEALLQYCPQVIRHKLDMDLSWIRGG